MKRFSIVKSDLWECCLVTREITSKVLKDGIGFAFDMPKENADLICKLLNENESEDVKG